MTLDKYFMAHKIIGIGCGNTDIIVDNPFDFVDDIASMKYFIGLINKKNVSPRLSAGKFSKMSRFAKNPAGIL